MNDRFDVIIEKTLKHEGGYSNDKKDSGGETKYGISKKAHPNEDIKNLTKERAIEIYRNQYWKKPKISLIEDDSISQKVFDIGVNVGSNRSIKFLQRALNEIYNSLTVDGIMGNHTLKATNAADKDKLLYLYKKHAKQYYESLNQPRFIKGWLNRLES